jgi:hypothetical protein
MKHLKITLPDALYGTLAEVARGTDPAEAISPSMWATEMLASELAARRLASQPFRPARAHPAAVKPYRLALPEVL